MSTISLGAGLVTFGGAACAAGALLVPLTGLASAATVPTGAVPTVSSVIAAKAPVLEAVEPAAAARLLKAAGTTARGTGYQAYRWKDAGGVNVLLTTRQVQDREAGLIRNGVIRVYQGIGLGTDRARVVQQVTETNTYDEGRCDLDGGIDTTLNSTRATDADGDGVAEVTVGWWQACHGDVSPASVSLAVLEHGNVSVLGGFGSPRNPRPAEVAAGVFPPAGEVDLPPLEAERRPGSAGLNPRVHKAATTLFHQLYR